MQHARTQEIEVPWIREGVLTQRLFHDSGPNGKSRFHKFDIWHCWHLGCGKHWAGSGLMLVQSKIARGNIDERFEVLNSAYVDFCRQSHIPKILGKLDKHCCGITLPDIQGTWNKAAVTSNLCLFLEDFLIQNPDIANADERIATFAPYSYAWTVFVVWSGFAFF